MSEIFNYETRLNATKIREIKVNQSWHESSCFLNSLINLSQLGSNQYEVYTLNIDDFRENLECFFQMLNDNLNEAYKLEPGDIVKMEGVKLLNNVMYHHHALISDSAKLKIIHKWGEPTGIEIPFTLCGVEGFAQVREDNLLEVVALRKMAKENCYDEELGSQIAPREEIVKRARERIGENTYGLLTDNCQHFCTKCRYGVERSIEVKDATTKIAVGTAAGALFVLAINAARYFLSSRNDKQNVKKDNKKD